MKLSIIVPCYNEAKNIPIVLQRFAAVITEPDIELIFVNNGSTDDAWTAAFYFSDAVAAARIIITPVTVVGPVANIVTDATIMYLNVKTNSSNINAIYCSGTGGHTIIKASLAYL